MLLFPDEIAEKVVKELGAEQAYEQCVCEADGKPVGMLVAVEGVDGAGLSTHAAILAESLKRAVKGAEVYVTKEPTLGPMGSIIWMALRGVLPGLERPELLALLYAADRLYHLYADPLSPRHRGVLAALRDGCIVVTDRYKYSSLAYQTVELEGLSGAPRRWVWEVNSFAPPAAVVVFLDVPPSVAAARVVRTRAERHLYEVEERLRAVYASFLDLLKELEQRGEDVGPWRERVGRPLECLYPRGLRYPRVIRVREVVDSTERSVESVALEVVEKVLRAAVEEGYLRKR